MNAQEQIKKMNALDLANELDWMTPEKLIFWCNSVQSILREQQAEIEALKSKSLAKDELKIMWQAAMSKAYKEEKNEAYEFFADLILEKVREK